MLLSNPILIKFSAAAAQCMNWALVFNLWPFWIIKMHSKELMLLFFSGKTEPSTAADPPMDKTTVFYIAVGVACGIILIMALAVAAIHVHSMPSPNKEGLVMYVMFIVRACLLCLALTTCTEYIAQIIRRQIAMQQMGYSSQNLQPLNSQAQIFDLLLPLHPDFQNCLSFPPLGFPGSKNSPPPPHTHTHTHTLLDYVTCLNVLHAAAEGERMRWTSFCFQSFTPLLRMWNLNKNSIHIFI